MDRAPSRALSYFENAVCKLSGLRAGAPLVMVLVMHCSTEVVAVSEWLGSGRGCPALRRGPPRSSTLVGQLPVVESRSEIAVVKAKQVAPGKALYIMHAKMSWHARVSLCWGLAARSAPAVGPAHARRGTRGPASGQPFRGGTTAFQNTAGLNDAAAIAP